MKILIAHYSPIDPVLSGLIIRHLAKADTLLLVVSNESKEEPFPFINNEELLLHTSNNDIPLVALDDLEIIRKIATKKDFSVQNLCKVYFKKLVLSIKPPETRTRPPPQDGFFAGCIGRC